MPVFLLIKSFSFIIEKHKEERYLQFCRLKCLKTALIIFKNTYVCIKYIFLLLGVNEKYGIFAA